MRACRFFGFPEDARRIERIFIPQVLGRKNLSVEDVLCVWVECDRVGSLGQRYPTLRDTAYTDAIIYNLLNARFEEDKPNSQVESRLNDPDMRVLKKQFVREWESGKSDWETIREFLKRCASERRASALAGHPSPPHSFLPGDSRFSSGSSAISMDSDAESDNYHSSRLPSPFGQSLNTAAVAGSNTPNSQHSLSPAPLTPPPSSPALSNEATRSSDLYETLFPLEGRREYRTQSPRGRRTNRSHGSPSRARSHPPPSPHSLESSYLSGVARSDTTSP
ncbi:hypothetical protein BDV96DRAFT_568448 [Lophiotrema nucula]|uniref:Uncharacterized protein n=1 Tax=Lophiotrema nucula TaxID=690887 RepID=A0A6A5ZH29_9PLEO|nr:hypothetical protein BDV96DRAFT_568448 [Lophiotrema nucula]